MAALVSPSILAADFTRLAEEADAVIRAGADFIHYDVMDNHFVPNLSFGFRFVSRLMEYTGGRIKSDVHLMIENPEASLDRFLAMEPDMLTFHIEAADDPAPLIKRIRENGKTEAWLSIKPGTALSRLEQWLPEVDGILIMLVEPGFSGQKMLPETVSRIAQLRKMAAIKGTTLKIEIDGGIKKDNFPELVDLGADILVLGSGLFGEQDYTEAVDRIHQYIPERLF